MYKEFQVNSVELHVQLQVHFFDKLEIHRKNHSNVLLCPFTQSTQFYVRFYVHVDHKV